jgi:hypothetical protein
VSRCASAMLKVCYGSRLCENAIVAKRGVTILLTAPSIRFEGFNARPGCDTKVLVVVTVRRFDTASVESGRLTVGLEVVSRPSLGA